MAAPPCLCRWTPTLICFFIPSWSATVFPLPYNFIYFLCDFWTVFCAASSFSFFSFLFERLYSATDSRAGHGLSHTFAAFNLVCASKKTSLSRFSSLYFRFPLFSLRRELCTFKKTAHLRLAWLFGVPRRIKCRQWYAITISMVCT